MWDGYRRCLEGKRQDMRSAATFAELLCRLDGLLDQDAPLAGSGANVQVFQQILVQHYGLEAGPAVPEVKTLPANGSNGHGTNGHGQ